jgi:hypothetical protein
VPIGSINSVDWQETQVFNFFMVFLLVPPPCDAEYYIYIPMTENPGGTLCLPLPEIFYWKNLGGL